jgi:hypothetical protein
MSYSQNFAPAQFFGSARPGNGRVDARTVPGQGRVQIQQMSLPAGNTHCMRREGVHSATPLSNLFFSVGNVNAVHEGIRYRVWVTSNGRFSIGRQNERELLIIMRSTYHQHARHSPHDIVGQVRALNAIVINWAVPQIMTNLLSHQQYIKDISHLPVPMQHAPMATMKGTRSLPGMPRW